MEKEIKKENEKLVGVKGWLLLFCLSLTIFIPLSTIFYLISSYNEKSILFEKAPGLKIIQSIEITGESFILIIGLIAGIKLWKINKHAVRFAKGFLLVSLFYSAISISFPYIIDLPENIRSFLVKSFFIGLVTSIPYFIIWFWYLTVSKRVKNTYFAI